MCGSYHPAGGAGTLPGHVVARSSVLAGAALLTLWAVFPRRTRFLAAGGHKNSVSQTDAGGSTLSASRRSQGSGVSRGAQALPRLVVAGGAVEALALQEAVLAEEAGVAGLLAAPALEALGADARPRDGVALGPVATLALVAAVRPPEVVFTA